MQFARLNFWKSSISARIVIVFSLTFALCICLAFFISYLQIDGALEETSQQVINSKFHEDAAILSEKGIEGLASFLAVDENRAENLPYLVQVFDLEGNTVFHKPSAQKQKFEFPSHSDKIKDLKPLIGRHSLSADDDEDKFDMFGEAVGSKYILLVGRSSENREAILGQILNSFALTAVAFILFGCVAGVLAAKNIVAPIRNLLSTIKEIEFGDLSRRVSTETSLGEMKDLGETFNRMITRIDKLVTVMKESLDNVAHDIRTPLTRIKAVAEDALTSKQPGALSLALEDCAESATSISELVDQLMSISEADAGALKLSLEPCSIQNLISGVVEIYDFVAQGQDVEIRSEVSPTDLNWNFDRKRISQVIANLLDNAVKFSPAKSSILVSAGVENEQLEIRVRDQGQGIPKDDLPKIWDRLFRSDRSRSTPGLGLGLSIVRAVVSAHGGAVTAEPNPDQGMTFLIRLPKR